MTEKEILSQEEIDALLYNVDDEPENAEASEAVCTPDFKKKSKDKLIKIEVSVSTPMGRIQMTTHNVKKLHQGDILALERIESERMDVLVNGTLVAHGELVVVNDKLSVRLTDIVSKW